MQKYQLFISLSSKFEKIFFDLASSSLHPPLFSTGLQMYVVISSAARQK
jgi:hypothetical protein